MLNLVACKVTARLEMVLELLGGFASTVVLTFLSIKLLNFEFVVTNVREACNAADFEANTIETTT
jgi:hypothetical protein